MTPNVRLALGAGVGLVAMTAAMVLYAQKQNSALAPQLAPTPAPAPAPTNATGGSGSANLNSVVRT